LNQQETNMTIANRSVLITGANRGIGRALVDEALRRGAKRVYAGTRGAALQVADERVTPLALDVTNATQIQRAVEQVGTLDVLINNAVSPSMTIPAISTPSKSTWPSICSASSR
jgi:NAD(P)-dependent dehydrogenase (short-subunit alcohol dehydrogenase family)